MDQTNNFRHYNKMHQGSSPIILKRIEELKELTDEFTPRAPSSHILEESIGSSASADLRTELVKFAIKSGSSMDVIVGNDMRRALEAAQKLPKGSSLTLGRDACDQEVISQYKAMIRSLRQDLEDPATSGFGLSIDNWDLSKLHKILYVTIVLTRSEDYGFSRRNYPFTFRLLNQTSLGLAPKDEDGIIAEVDGITVLTLSSSEALEAEICAKMERNGLSWSKFVGAVGCGAANGATCANRLDWKSALIEHLMELCANETMEVIPKPLQCAGHILGLAIKGAVGFCKTILAHENPSPQSVGILLAKVRKAASFCNESKASNSVKNAAKQVHVIDLPGVHLDMDAHWLSTFKMLEGINAHMENLNLVAKSMKKQDVVFSEYEVVALREIEAILRPVVVACSFLETSPLSVTSYVLPVLTAVCTQYGIDINAGILDLWDGVHSTDDDFLEQNGLDAPEAKWKAVFKAHDHVKFRVTPRRYQVEPKGSHADASLQPDVHEQSAMRTDTFRSNPREESWRMSQMTPYAISFFDILRRHLFARVILARKNANAIELLSSFVNPIGNCFFDAIVGDASEQAWTKVMARFITALSRPKGEKARSKPSIVAGFDSESKSNQSSDDDCGYSSKKRVKTVEGRSADDDEHSKSVAKEITLFTADAVSFVVAAQQGERYTFNWSPERLRKIKGKRPRLQIASVIDCFETLGPSAFWTTTCQTRYPIIFSVAAKLVACLSHSCLQESVISSAGETLTEQGLLSVTRPDLLEAIVMLRCYLNVHDQALLINAKSRAAIDSECNEHDIAGPALKANENETVD